MAAARLAAIEAELARLGDHEWAGEHHTQSNLVGDRVLLAPEGGVVHQPWTDYGGPHIVNSGRVMDVTEDRIALELELPTITDERPPYSAELIRITWGSGRYLVWHDRLERFKEEVARGPPTQTEFAWAMLKQADSGRAPGSPAESGS